MKLINRQILPRSSPGQLVTSGFGGLATSRIALANAAASRAAADRGGGTVTYVGDVSEIEWHMPAVAGEPEPHLHKTFGESFCITARAVRLYDGGRWVDARPVAPLRAREA